MPYDKGFTVIDAIVVPGGHVFLRMKQERQRRRTSGWLLQKGCEGPTVTPATQLSDGMGRRIISCEGGGQVDRLF